MEIRLDWRKGKLWLRDIPVGGGECDAARELLRLGAAKPEDRIVTFRGGMACMTAGVGWLAAREVGMNTGGTPIFRKRKLSGGPRAGKNAGA